MPVVDIAPPSTNFAVDTPQGFAVTPFESDINQGSEGPSAGEVYRAAFRLDNTIGSTRADLTGDLSNEDDGTNPWDDIKNTYFEPQWKRFVDARNQKARDLIKEQIMREEEDRKTLAAAPLYQSVPAQIAAGTIDLPTLLPAGSLIRGVRGGYSVARSALSTGAAAAVGAGVQEGVLHSTQQTRTLEESGVNVGASFFLGGLLGAGGAKLLSNVEWNRAVQNLERELAGQPAATFNAPGSAGAAAVEPMDIEGNAIAGKAASAVAAATARLNPALRLLQSPSAATRETATKLFENSLYLKKNAEGVASEPSVETLMKEWNAGLAKAVTSTDDAYAEYRKAGGQLTRPEFREAVGGAMRRGDDDADPFIASVAKDWRANVFDPLKEAAIKAKLLPEDVSVETAASYFSRMWNRNKLVAQEGRFKQIVAGWLERQAPKWAEEFDRETLAKAAKLTDDKLKEWETTRRIERDARFGSPKDTIRDIVDEVYNTLTGRTGPGVRSEFVTVKSRGPLKERTFNIPDHLVEDFLESDVDIVGRRYTRIMGADVEMAGKFGSTDMAEQIQKIREDYARLRSGLTDEKALSKLGEQETADIRDIEALRDLLRGTRIESPIERNYGRIFRMANMVNYIRAMGEVVWASLTDAVRPAMVHGLAQYMETVPKLLAGAKGVKLSVGEAKRAGNIAETVLAHRLGTIAEIIDPYASRSPVEALLENGTNVASKWNGIRIWTDMMKAVASVMTQDRIIKGVLEFGGIKQKERAYLAYLGIDESMAERIAKQFSAHGETVDGVKVANTESWTDPVAVRTYRAAMNKDVDSIIVMRGVADVPLFAQTPTGRLLLQFKTFALASHQRILLRGLQEDQSRFLGGMVAMTTMGMLITYLKAVSGNRTEKQSNFFDNPGWWIGEGLDRSGVLSIPMEIANTFERATGLNPIKSPMKMFDEDSAQSQKMQNRNEVGALLGPSAGLAQDIMNAGGIPKRVAEGEEITQGQKNAAERLLPFNSYAGMRQLLRYVVNAPE